MPEPPGEVLELPESLWAAVHQGAGGAWPPLDENAMAAFIAQASREGLLPLLFESRHLPPAVRGALAGHRARLRLAEARTSILVQALRAVAEMLRDEPFVVLKGADYMWRLYARPELRPMQDLDLLVRRERIDAVCERLLAAGLTPRPTTRAARAAPSYYERAFLLGEVIVEVHHSFLQRSRHRVDYEALWSRRLAWPELAPEAARLADADALAYHALGMAKDEFSVPLIRCVDLWLMMTLAPRALPEAAARARQWRASRALFGALHQAARFFPQLRDGEPGALMHSLVGPLTRRFLDRFVLPRAEEQGQAGAVTRGRQLWRKFWLIDGVHRRLSFALQHAGASMQGWWTARSRST